MGRLIIIGNGYDMGHLNGATSYKKFGEWLCEKYKLTMSSDNNKLPFSRELNIYSGDFYRKIVTDFPSSDANAIDKKRNAFFAAMLVNMINELNDDNWSDFETDLGRLPWAKYIKKADKYFGKHNSFGSPVSFGTEFITSSVGSITSMFAEWISSIDCSNIEKNGFDYSLKCINNDDTIIIFNYTDTFERLFCLSPEDSRVCHIHGKASDKKTIIVGHGGNRANCKSNNLDCCSDYMLEAKAVLYKDTKKIIKNNDNVWQKIERDFIKGDSNEIYVYGWSCSKEDKPYLKKIIEIVEKTKKESSLFLCDYNNEGRIKRKSWIKNGFKGNITFFTIKGSNIIYRR